MFSISTTTRQMRPGEVDGRDHQFVSVDEFFALAARNEFIEHTQVFARMCGTLRAPMKTALAAGRLFLLEIDVQGPSKNDFADSPVIGVAGKARRRSRASSRSSILRLHGCRSWGGRD